jgi:hypothetical protein
MANLGLFNFNSPRLLQTVAFRIPQRRLAPRPLVVNPPGLPYAVWASQRASNKIAVPLTAAHGMNRSSDRIDPTYK